MIKTRIIHRNLTSFTVFTIYIAIEFFKVYLNNVIMVYCFEIFHMGILTLETQITWTRYTKKFFVPRTLRTLMCSILCVCFVHVGLGYTITTCLMKKKIILEYKLFYQFLIQRIRCFVKSKIQIHVHNLTDPNE